ncbi:MAG: 4Fe-4S binding protein [Candidatus Heimdallarchaeaceae archaeon]
MKLKSGQMIGPGAAVSRITGAWSNEKANIDQEKCIQCLQCFFHCPEGTIHKKEESVRVIKTYCKACGICINVCPVNAITMEEINDYKDILS